MVPKERKEVVQKLYIAFYGRPADPGGLIHWISKMPERLDFDSKEFREFVSNFINSEEALERFGEPKVVTAIKRIYNYALGRDATEEEVASYANRSVVDLLVNILKLNTGVDYEMLKRKVEYAELFVSILDPNQDGLPNDDLSGRRFMATFVGNMDAEIAKALLLLNSKEVFNKESVANDIKKYIADPGDPILSTQDNISLLELALTKSRKNLGYAKVANKDLYEVWTLDLGAEWDKKTITFSFLEADPGLNYSEWRPLDRIQREIVREILRKVSSYVDLNFIELSSGGDIQFGSANLAMAEGVTMWKISPSDRSFIPPVYILLDNRLQQQRDEFFYKIESGYTGRGVYTIIHEIGHALGLKHPFDPPYVLDEELDNVSLTVMSYNDNMTAVPYFVYTEKEIKGGIKLSHSPTNFSLFDYETLQVKYGARMTSNQGDTIYDKEYFVRTNQPYFAVIWDVGGNDILDLRFHKGPIYVKLSDGSTSDLYVTPDSWITFWTNEMVKKGADKEFAYKFIKNYVYELSDSGNLYEGVNSLAILRGTIIENVITGDYEDWIEDNQYDNLIQTGGGDDVVYVSSGFDTVDGGEGYDRVFVPSSKRDALYGNFEGEWIVVGEDFAVKLIGVEEVVFKDVSLFLS